MKKEASSEWAEEMWIGLTRGEKHYFKSTGMMMITKDDSQE